MRGSGGVQQANAYFALLRLEYVAQRCDARGALDDETVSHYAFDLGTMKRSGTSFASSPLSEPRLGAGRWHKGTKQIKYYHDTNP